MKNKRWSIFLTLIPIAILYWQTLAPTIVQIDSGELAAVQSTLGIAHPTGYPLFTILGYLFLQFPIFSSKILQLNFLSMSWCLFALLVIQLSFHHLVKVIDRDADTQSRQLESKRSNHDRSCILPCVSSLAILFLAFNKTFWAQGTAIEVHSLQSLIYGSILLTLILATVRNKSKTLWLLSALFLGLGTSNHLTTVLAFPGIIVFFFLKNGVNKKSWLLLGMMILVFSAVVAMLYLYLPWRSAQNPMLNWGNPATVHAFFRHVTGKQYSTWMFQSLENALQHLYMFLKTLPEEFSYPGLALGLVGLFVLPTKNRDWSILFFLLFFFSVFYAINYDIHDIETYFLSAYIVFVFWIFVGIFQIVQWIPKPGYRSVFLILVAAGSIHQGCKQFSSVDQSETYLYSDYTQFAMQSLPSNCLLLTYQWDYLVSPSLYFRLVEQCREDIAIIDKELLRRSWYYHQLRINHPQLIESTQTEIDLFLQALAPFETGKPYDAPALESRYRRVMTGLIQSSLSRKMPVFIAPELVNNEFRRGELILPPGSKLVPHLFFFQLATNDEYLSIPDNDIQLRFPKTGNRYSDSVKELVANMWIWRTFYELQHDNTKNGFRLKKLLQSHFPDLPLPKQIQDSLGSSYP